MNKILIFGAGPVGCALATLLSRAGYEVSVCEKRSRKECEYSIGRSVNIALSFDAWQMFERIELTKRVQDITIPMYGRMIHDSTGESESVSITYSGTGEALFSVNRSELNKLMIERAEETGVVFSFQYGCEHIESDRSIVFTNSTRLRGDSFLYIVGADGANSEVRFSMTQSKWIEAERVDVNFGYVEIDFPSRDGKYLFPENHLHIWSGPENRNMIIALPNTDGTFTGGVFAPLVGIGSFEEIQEKGPDSYFSTNFKNVVGTVPDFFDQYNKVPARMSEVHSKGWTKNGVVLVGDSAHAVTPFLGKGLNFGLRNAGYLADMILSGVHNPLDAYEKYCKPEAKLLMNWAQENFADMAKSATPEILLRKEIEYWLEKKSKGEFLSFHSMISFTGMSHKDIETEMKRQDQAFVKVLNLPNVHNDWQNFLWSQIKTIMIA